MFSRNRGKKRFGQKKRVTDSRIELLRWFFIALAVVIIAKLFFLQVVQGAFYSALASDQHEIYRTLFPERGKIYIRDRSSISNDEGLYPVAVNKDYKTVYAQPRFISDPVTVAEALAPVLEIPVEDLMLRLDKPNDPYEVLKRKVDDSVYQRVSDLALEGVKFQDETYRFYPEKNIGANIWGFVGVSDDRRIGQYGLEGYFDERLQGSLGTLRSEKDVSGRWISSTSKFYTPAVDGADLVLTIDKTLQYQACSVLNEQAEFYQAESATVIIMDPFTGAIMAICSYPDFDPNEYNKVDSVRVYNNTAIFDAYEPGSIFKPIGMAAALDTGLVTPDTTYIDNGEVKVGGFTIRNSDREAHGKVDMVEVLNKSLNTGMIFVLEKLGTAQFKRYVENFGFGKTTGIRLKTEVAGDISSLDRAGKIYGYTASYGQGITVTPLQMVQAFGAIANGGYLVKPYIVDEIRDGERVEKHESKPVQKVLDAKTSTLLGGMLTSVVKFGHGSLADVEGYDIAGKTGTAQIADFERGGYSSRTNQSFIGYGPVDNPVFVMLVKFEDPKVSAFSASTAAPTFGRIAKFLLNYLQIPPED